SVKSEQVCLRLCQNPRQSPREPPRTHANCRRQIVQYQDTPVLAMKLSSINPAAATQRGITFVDVLMATAVITTMSLGVIGSLTYGFFVMQMARENQRATQVMLEKVETLR